MKNLTIAGRITRDAVTRSTQQGEKVTGFSVAVDDGYGQNKRAMFFDCSLWGKRGDSLAQHLTKGSQVTVSGDLSTREHEGKTYLTIRVADLTLQGKPQGTSGGGRSDDYDRQSSGSQQSSRSDYDDSIPF
ncbi:single-stranded DNA-binding protein [Paracoccus sp. SY]|uniref:single-stranded DNA-binding protein n=1 Tax=Paracoccus sp. SY TaxID=1330255 RepID=UPI000CD32698|nr:single-stranded DNA-binding protein [Paracoccus sp. SY]